MLFFEREKTCCWACCIECSLLPVPIRALLLDLALFQVVHFQGEPASQLFAPPPQLLLVDSGAPSDVYANTEVLKEAEESSPSLSPSLLACLIADRSDDRHAISKGKPADDWEGAFLF